HPAGGPHSDDPTLLPTLLCRTVPATWKLDSSDRAAVMTGTSSDQAPASGRWLLLSAALLWSTSGLLVKCPPMQTIPLDVRGPLLACYRVLFAAACVAPFVNWRSVRFRPALIGMTLSYAA